MLDFALYYASRGWRVFPCEPKGKKPLIPEWQKAATTDESTIRAWWSRWPDANIGMATGFKSGVFVLDVDGPAGSQSLTALEEEIGEIPETLEQKTGRLDGGRQLFFKMQDREVRNKQNFRDGLDIRGEGGYVIMPPSIHPDSGNAYEWPYGLDTCVLDAPRPLLDVIRPEKKAAPPWEQSPQPVKAVSSPPVASGDDEVLNRASLYLRECKAAVQGAGGHDALLWAARAMVVGFQLQPSQAISLLWSDFNPRCSPPWDASKAGDVKDFERKVGEALRTPGEKPVGWLLDKYDLRSGEDKLAEIAKGAELADNLLASAAAEADSRQKAPEVEVEITGKTTIKTPAEYTPFPIEYFPPEVKQIIEEVAKSHTVDVSYVAFPVIAVTATAMGNKFRAFLKGGFKQPPTLWLGLIGTSGTNKSGPLDAIMEPLRHSPDISKIDDPILCPQGRLVVSDATIEAVIAKLNESPVGLMNFRDEFAAWLKTFNVYKGKNGGADEQIWIQLWNAKEYQLDRKTDNEETFIPAASVCLLGGIQPSILAECFDPAKFASGLVPRLLVASPPTVIPYWSDAEISEELAGDWNGVVEKIRLVPFESLDASTGKYQPHIITLSPRAKERYVAYYNKVVDSMKEMTPLQLTFASKSRLICARLALCHYGLMLATGRLKLGDPMPVECVIAGAAWAEWCLMEQLRVYGIASETYQKETNESLISSIAALGGKVTVRRMMRLNSRKFDCKMKTKRMLDELANSGLASWDVGGKVLTLKDIEDGNE